MDQKNNANTPFFPEGEKYHSPGQSQPQRSEGWSPPWVKQATSQSSEG